MAAERSNKSMMRNLGEFVGHVASAIRSDPDDSGERHEVKRTVEEHDEGDVIFRRTTIDEVEYRRDNAES